MPRTASARCGAPTPEACNCPPIPKPKRNWRYEAMMLFARRSCELQHDDKLYGSQVEADTEWAAAETLPNKKARRRAQDSVRNRLNATSVYREFMGGWPEPAYRYPAGASWSPRFVLMPARHYFHELRLPAAVGLP